MNKNICEDGKRIFMYWFVCKKNGQEKFKSRNLLEGKL